MIRIRQTRKAIRKGKFFWTMGGVCGSKPDGQYNNSSSQKLAQQLGIDDRTLTRLERVFQAIDFDGSGVSNFNLINVVRRSRSITLCTVTHH